MSVCTEGVTWLLVFKILVLGGIFIVLAIFVLKKVLFDSTQGAVNRLNRDTEAVRAKQAELNEKIKQANEELAKRRAEADTLALKMKDDAENKAREDRDKIIKKAREDAEEVISKAQKTKEDIRKVLEKEAEIKVLDFAGLLLEEVFTNKTMKALGQSIIEEFLDNLVSVDMSMVPPDLETAEVVIAAELSEELKKKLMEVVNKKLDREMRLAVTVDPAILNGIILRFGSLTLNGSLAYALKEKEMNVKDRMEKGLLKRGSKTA